MPNVNPGTATIIVQKISGLENFPELVPYLKLKCNFGSGNYKYTTGYSQINKDLECVWNRSAVINLKTDEQIKFKIKSKNNQFVCTSTLNVYQISSEDSKYIDLLCFMPNKSRSWKSRSNNHLRTPSFGSASLDMNMLQIPLKLVVKASGDIDFFRLQKKSSHRIVNLLHRSSILSKTPGKVKSTPDTPDHYDLKSISSLASISASKHSHKKNPETPSLSIRRKLSYDSSEASTLQGNQDLTVTADTSPSNSFEDLKLDDEFELDVSFLNIDNVDNYASMSIQQMRTKDCCNNKNMQLLNLNKILNELEEKNSDLHKAILKTSDQLDNLLRDGF